MQRLLMLFLLACSSVANFFVPHLFGSSLDSWHIRRPFHGTNEALGHIIFAQDQFLVLGNRGVGLVSKDGATWQEFKTPFIRRYGFAGWYGKSIAFGNGTFVVLDDRSRIFTSTNLTHWNMINSGSSSDLLAVTFGQGKFVVVGVDGSILTSPDGKDWSWQNSHTTAAFLDVEYGNNLFLTSGDLHKIMVSANGSDWEYGSSVYGNRFIAFGNGHFVIVASQASYRTLDGKYYEERRLRQESEGIAYGDGLFAAISETGVFSSSNGVDWAQHTLPPNASPAGIAFGNKTFVIVGKGGMILQSAPIPTTAPVILEQPTMLNTSAGSTARLAAYATGSDPKLFQWFKNGDKIPGATNTFLQIRDVKLSDSGDYSLEVSNEVGNALSLTARLNVEPPDAPLSNWHLRHSSVEGIPLKKIAYGKNIYLTIDLNGNIRKSTNGMQWPLALKLAATSFTNIRFFNDKFLAVGENGYLASSEDGAVWSISQIPGTGSLTDIVYGNGNYIAVDEDGKSHVSSNLLTWNSRQILPNTTLNAITFGGEKFIIVGSQGSIFSSRDGQTWRTLLTYTIDNLRAVAYGAGTYIAVGDFNNVLSSSDGERWRDVRLNWYLPGSVSDSTPPHLSFAEFVDGRFILASEEMRFSGDSRLNGHHGSISSSPDYLLDTSVSNDVPIGIGVGGGLLSGSGFEPTATDHAYHLRSIAAMTNVLVAVGNAGAILMSSNTFDWTPAESPTTNNLRRVFSNGEKFIALGDFGTILSSQDGYQWKSHNSGTERIVHDIAFGNGLFVAIASTNVLTSSDGETWSAENDFSGYSRQVKYANGTFLIRDDYQVHRSEDGRHWTPIMSWTNSLSSLGQIRALGITSSQFFLITPEKLLTSTNGLNWSIHPLQMDSSGFYHNIVRGPEALLAIHFSGHLSSSYDLSNWMNRKPGTTWDLYDGVYFQNSFFLVGDYGTVVQSDPLTPTAPRILRHPEFRASAGSSETELQINAIGTSPLTYQWRRDGTPIPEATNATLRIVSPDRAHEGRYDVVVSNPLGNETSTATFVTLNPSCDNCNIPAKVEVKRTNNDWYELQLNSKPGLFLIESSDDLSWNTRWKPLAVVNSPASWPIPKAGSAKAQFFRISPVIDAD